MKRISRLALPPALFLPAIGAGLFLCGLVFGTLAGLSMMPSPPITLHEDTRPSVAVVRLEGLRDSSLRGTLSGEVRLFAGDAIILPDGSGAFRITDRKFLTNVITIRAPAGMRFVASKRGHTYYPIGSNGGESIVPANRIYFADSERAIRAGYKAAGK